jgi:thiol-disulfide isomerase/thioredoxin
MKTSFFILFIAFFSSYSMFGQHLSGTFSDLQNQIIRLEGFDGLKSYLIDTTNTDGNGNFKLKYAAKDYGMGYLVSNSNKPLILILANEDTEIKGSSLEALENIQFTKGFQNQTFERYANEYPKKEQALSAWVYLSNLYKTDPLFINQKNPLKAIETEKTRIKESDTKFLNSLPKDSYVRWFLPIRKLVSSVSVVAQYKPEEIPSTLVALRAIDYADPRLYKSGLFKEAIENHVWFIENTSGSLELVYKDLNQSIDILLQQVKADQTKFNEVTDFLFNLLEKRSLFTSSEYLALKLLNDESCTLSDNIAKQMEGYRKMKKGNIAPNIQFTEFSYFPAGVNVKDLDDLKSDFTLVVFAASWCSHCVEEIPKIAALYPELKAKNIEVILVSLDENASSFAQFAAPLPFISTTDYKKWEGQIVQDYHVFGTPTYYLLNKKREIVLRPHSVSHLGAYINLMP